MRRPGDPTRPGFEDCTGCRVCVLPCPVWRQTHDVTLTVAGRAKALQRGFEAADLRVSLEACVVCGACEVVCPVGIDTVGMTLDLRTQLEASALRDAVARMPSAPVVGSVPEGLSKAWLLPGLGLRGDAELLARVCAVLARRGTRLAQDDGTDLRIALEAGLPIDAARRERFLAPLRGANELVVGDGLLHRPLREWLPGTKVIGLGEVLLLDAAVLGPTDLLVLETRGFHADFGRLVRHYDALRQTSGCMMSLDLQRAAIPTGAASLQALAGAPSLDVADQVRWIVEGRPMERIVVEDVADRVPFAEATGLPVLHLGEFASGGER